MDRQAAARALDEALTPLRGESWAQLRARIGAGEVVAWEVRGAGGARWQIEVTFHWDGRAEEAIRVLASVDDGTLCGALRPVCADWIVPHTP